VCDAASDGPRMTTHVESGTGSTNMSSTATALNSVSKEATMRAGGDVQEDSRNVCQWAEVSLGS